MSNPVITKFFNYQHFVPYWGFFIPNNKTSSAADTFFLVSIPTRGLLIPNSMTLTISPNALSFRPHKGPLNS